MSSVLSDSEPEEPQGALETGLWCQSCLLPSGVRWPIVTRLGHRLSKADIIACYDCGALLDENGRVVDEIAG